MPSILALDQGTSSSRSLVVDGDDGRVAGVSQREIRQIFPEPGRVEHDPEELWQSQLSTAREAIASADVDVKEIATIGIANQRETTLIWHRRTGKPIHPAIVWQDRRTESMCSEWRGRGLEVAVRRTTGLVLDAYFSASKVRWLLDHVPGARTAAERGELAFGTVDSWLLWRLTGGRVHATDVSNASRTMLFDIRRNEWDDELLAAFGIPHLLLPEVLPSSHFYGESDPALFGAALPITGVAGDQQSALFGQACIRPGLAKNTYGTGCFLLMPSGERCRLSSNGLLTTRAAQTDARPTFAFEGSVFVGGAVVQWLRDGLRTIAASAEVEALAASVPDAGGVCFVPAFTGLGAPYWNTAARGTITGLTRGSSAGHIARAAVESIAFQSAALLAAMNRDAEAGGDVPVTELRVDGGACVNDALMQFQADLLGIPVVRPRVVETTAFGAAMLAGLGAGLYRDADAVAALWQAERVFHPTMTRARAAERMAEWEHAVAQATAVPPPTALRAAETGRDAATRA